MLYDQHALGREYEFEVANPSARESDVNCSLEIVSKNTVESTDIEALMKSEALPIIKTNAYSRNDRVKKGENDQKHKRGKTQHNQRFDVLSSQEDNKLTNI